MNKWIIGSLVGAIIVFLWQFLSWNVLLIHSGETKYTPQQEEILSALSSANLEEGKYLMPIAPTQKETQQQMSKNAGKPWAWIFYSPSLNTSTTTPIIMGAITDILLVILLISILVRGGLPSFTGIFTGSVAVGVFTFLWGPYAEHNWFQMPWSTIQGRLIDAIVAWGLCGLWLGWWLRRPVSA